METLVLTRDGLQIADTPIPPLMPGDVRIEVRSVGVGERDIAIWNGEVEVKHPIVLGYEFTGVVHESSVHDFPVGQMVTADIDIGCQRCWYCRNKQPQHCNNKKTLGLTRDGALAEYVTVPADLVYPLPSEIDRISATFVQPLASAVNIVESAKLNDNEPVLVIGSGEMGLLVAQVFDAYGADVYLAGDNRWRLGVARQLGMTNTLNWSDKDWMKKVFDNTSGVGPKIVIETKGENETIDMALKMIRNGGDMVLTQMPLDEGIISTSTIVEKGIKVFGNKSTNFPEAIDMLEKRRIEVKRLVNKEFKLEEGTRAFEHASEPSVTKVIINI